MTILKRKPKIIRNCPRWDAGHTCHAVNGVPCPDCGRGIVQPVVKSSGELPKYTDIYK